jgi:hypothetical protein
MSEYGCSDFLGLASGKGGVSESKDKLEKIQPAKPDAEERFFV